MADKYDMGGKGDICNGPRVPTDTERCNWWKYNWVICLSIVYLYRYGKPVVLDMMDVDMFDTVTMKFDEVKKGLMASLMSKDLLKDSKWVARLNQIQS